MPKKKKPRSGSLAFVPKKRAKRIYPRIKNLTEQEKTKISVFSGYKVGMVHCIIMDNRKNSPTKGEEISVPSTVLDCPPLKVLGIRLYESDANGLKVLTEVWTDETKKDKDLTRKIRPGNYSEEKLKKIENDLDKIQEIRLIVRTHPKQSGIGKKKPEVFETPVSGKTVKERYEYSKQLLGQEIKINDIFKEGEYVDVSAVTKGKGTQGPVKRFGVKIQGRKAAGKRRHVGTLGSETPRRVLWTVPMAGQLGFQNRTEYNKRILKIGDNGNEITPKSGFLNYGVVRGNYLLLEGSVPGPKKRLVMMRNALRVPKIRSLVSEIKHIEK